MGRAAVAANLDTEAALRVLANPSQRRALEVVTASEISSGALAEACGWSPAATSRNLRALREAALVDVRGPHAEHERKRGRSVEDAEEERAVRRAAAA